MKGLLARWRRWREKKHSNRVASYEKLIRKSLVHKQERRAAIEFFADYEDGLVAVRALLRRFEFSDDNSIVDSTEKEAALRGIVAHKEEAVGLITEHLQGSDRIAWPLKALHALAGEEKVVQTLEGCLDMEDNTFDQAKIEKNYDILCHFMDYDIRPDMKKIVHFTRSHDERLRFAAVELLVEYKEPPLSVLEPFVFDESAENTRLRVLVMEAYSAQRWRLKDTDRLKTLRVPGYSVQAKGLLVKAKVVDGRVSF